MSQQLNEIFSTVTDWQFRLKLDGKKGKGRLRSVKANSEREAQIRAEIVGAKELGLPVTWNNESEKGFSVYDFQRVVNTA